jgi:hypothetical protein
VRQIADAIITGFAKSPLLIERSLAPLRQLRQEGLLRTIRYVTWDNPELDTHVAPLANMPDVEVTRVLQPMVEGTPPQKNLIYQIVNLEAALATVPEQDAVVLKTRPDCVVKVDFLRERLNRFNLDQAAPDRTALGMPMPAPCFQNKIWLPWADSNQPFFYEDATFMGRKTDLLRLLTPLTAADLKIAAEPGCSHYVHIVRFGKIFLESYPLFRRYLQNHHLFTNDINYRLALIGEIADDAFYWFLLVAHAWILHSHFHVDCGEQGDIGLYANHVNKDADWSAPATWRITSPFDRVAEWRSGTQPGRMMATNHRPFGRLMDNAWQGSIFSQEQPDFPRTTLRGLLEHIPHTADGRLTDLENGFYARLEAFHARYMESALERLVANANPRGGLADSGPSNALAGLPASVGGRA